MADHSVALEFERSTLGSDFGANGYGTLAEVGELVELLELGPGRRLLDIGSGHGWPGLFLARESGCTVVLTDVPFDGLAAAARRATRDGLAQRAWCLAAGGQRLPLRTATFDAVDHTDVLCCVREKEATLRASWRVLVPGRCTAFTTIFPAPNLSDVQRQRAVEAGPPFCAVRTTYPEMLRAAGFVEIDEHVITGEYLITARRKLDEAERLADGMADLLGHEEFDRVQAGRRHTVDAITDGLLCRSRFVARKPGR